MSHYLQNIKTRVRRFQRSLGAQLAAAGSESPKFFVPHPQADRATYLRLYEEACAIEYPEIDAIERRFGFAIDRRWMNDLALHAQVVIKKSRLNFQHGRVLYATLRDYLARTKPPAVTIIETGTARGFSSLCMARALADARQPGTIVTFDILPHDQPMYWNCIDDHECQKSRRELLLPWQELCEKILFVNISAIEGLQHIAVPSVGFAFLDANHTLEDVMQEFKSVRARQKSGDVIVFDDVTPELFPGVVEALAAIKREGLYDVERLLPTDQRGYALAVRR